MITGGWISTRASGMKKNLYGNIGTIQMAVLSSVLHINYIQYIAAVNHLKSWFISLGIQCNQSTIVIIGRDCIDNAGLGIRIRMNLYSFELLDPDP
jgi:hypothetical protein